MFSTILRPGEIYIQIQPYVKITFKNKGGTHQGFPSFSANNHPQ